MLTLSTGNRSPPFPWVRLRDQLPPSTLREPLMRSSSRCLRRSLHEDVRRQILETVSKPEMLPPYGPLFADPEGFLWMQTSFPGDSVTTLRAIGGTDGERADIRLPRVVTVLEVGSDYLLGTYEAANGEPCIAMYSLHRTDR